MRRYWSRLTLLLVFFSQVGFCESLYVSLTGSDSNGNGSIGNPWGSITFGVSQLKAGDTLFIREGVYKESQISNLPKNEATSDNRITIKAFSNEKVVVTGSQDLSDTSQWTATNVANIFHYQGQIGANYDNFSQDGKSLRLMKHDGSINDIEGEGQWVRNAATGDIWAWVKGGGNPGAKSVAISDAYHIFSFPKDADYITLEDLTVEDAYYPLQIRSNYIEIKNVTVRNAFSDGIKVEGWHRGTIDPWDSVYGLIENCDIYHFGESAIDVTGGDYWTIRGNRIHHALPVRGSNITPDGYYTNGLMIKNENIGIVVEQNVFYDMFGRFGIITLGGNSYYDDRPLVSGAVIRNNMFQNVSGPYVISFSGAVDSAFINNLVVNSNLDNSGVASSPDALVQFREGYCDKAACLALNDEKKIIFPSERNTVSNNIFHNNQADYNYREFELYGADNDVDNVINGNIHSVARNSYFDGVSSSPANLAAGKNYDVAALVTNAGFVDEAKGLYQYANSSSVGVDQSIGDLAYGERSLNREARHHGSAVDVGPYEKVAYTAYIEDATTQGWITPPNEVVSVVSDSERGDVLHTSGDAHDTYWYFLEDATINRKSETVASWSSKSEVNQDHWVKFRVYTSANEYRNIIFYSSYTAANFTDAPVYTRYPLGTGQANNGDWKKYTYNLQAILNEGLAANSLPEETISYVERVYITGGVYLDDLYLHSVSETANVPSNQIAAWHFNESVGTWTEDSVGSRHGQLINMSDQSNPTDNNWVLTNKNPAIRINSTSHQYIEMPVLSGEYGNAVAASLWVNLNSNDSSQDYNAIISGLTGDNQYPRLFQKSGDRFLFQFNTDSSSTLHNLYSTNNAVTAGQWMHIVVSINEIKGEANLYLNGVLNNSLTFTPSTVSTGIDPVRAGSDSLSTHTINGSLDEIRLFNKALSTDEVSDLFTLGR